MSIEDQRWEEHGEALFHTEEVDAPKNHSPFTVLGLGALIGLLCWVGVDRNFSCLHVIGWTAVGALLASITLLPAFKKSRLKSIHVTRDGFTLMRQGSSRSFAWHDLEAARFQEYPIVNMGTAVRCFLFRSGGKNYEILGGFDQETEAALCAVMNLYLDAYDIPAHTPKMPTFRHILSQVGTWIFVLGGFGMLMAHFFKIHTLGTVFGISIMAAGSCIALMTWKERTSRLVLIATVVLIAGTIAVIWALDINVRKVLLDWEKCERKLKRPPWN